MEGGCDARMRISLNGRRFRDKRAAFSTVCGWLGRQPVVRLPHFVNARLVDREEHPSALRDGHRNRRFHRLTALKANR